MATLEFYVKGFQDFIRAACIRHVDLLHDDQTNVAFVRFQSEDDVNQVLNQGGQNLVIVSRYYGRASGQNADDMKLKQFAQLRFVCAAIPDPAKNISDVITDAVDKAFSIMMDFFTLFVKTQHDDNCGPLRGLELESATWNEVPEQPFLVQHYGWDLTIPFASELPSYDPSKWVSN